MVVGETSKFSQFAQHVCVCGRSEIDTDRREQGRSEFGGTQATEGSDWHSD